MSAQTCDFPFCALVKQLCFFKFSTKISRRKYGESEIECVKFYFPMLIVLPLVNSAPYPSSLSLR